MRFLRLCYFLRSAQGHQQPSHLAFGVQYRVCSETHDETQQLEIPTCQHSQRSQHVRQGATHSSRPGPTNVCRKKKCLLWRRMEELKVRDSSCVQMSQNQCGYRYFYSEGVHDTLPGWEFLPEDAPKLRIHVPRCKNSHSRTLAPVVSS